MVKNLPTNAEDTSSVPGLGESQILRSNYARAPRPHALQQEKPPRPEAQALQLENSSCLSQLEKAHEQQ